MLEDSVNYIHLDTFCACFKYLFELVQVVKFRNLLRSQFEEVLKNLQDSLKTVWTSGSEGQPEASKQEDDTKTAQKRKRS